MQTIVIGVIAIGVGAVWWWMRQPYHHRCIGLIEIDSLVLALVKGGYGHAVLRIVPVQGHVLEVHKPPRTTRMSMEISLSGGPETEAAVQRIIEILKTSPHVQVRPFGPTMENERSIVADCSADAAVIASLLKRLLNVGFAVDQKSGTFSAWLINVRPVGVRRFEQVAGPSDTAGEV